MENEIEVVPVAGTGAVVVMPTETGDDNGDDYQWLTERLDAHTAQQTELRTILQTQMDANREASQTAISTLEAQNRTLTTMVETLTAAQTRFMEAWELSRLTPPNLTLSLPEPEAEVIPVTIVEPESESILNATPEADANPDAQETPRGRRRL
jgi:hypothetical protein